MADSPLIWILGAESPRADRSFTWDKEIPILSDPDIIIVPISILKSKDIGSLRQSELLSIRHRIFEKFISGGKIIFILGEELSYSEPQSVPKHTKYYLSNPTIKKANYLISPIELDLRKISDLKIWNAEDRDFFYKYTREVKSIDLIIRSHMLADGLDDFEPSNPISKGVMEMLSENSKNIELISFPLIYDKSYNILSEKYWLKINGYWNSGELVYLPPISKESESRSIDMLLRIFDR